LFDLHDAVYRLRGNDSWLFDLHDAVYRLRGNDTIL